MKRSVTNRQIGRPEGSGSAGKVRLIRGQCRRVTWLSLLVRSIVAIVLPLVAVYSEPVTGQLSLRGETAWVSNNSIYRLSGKSSPLLDASTDLRLMWSPHLTSDLQADFHLDLGAVRGDRQEVVSELSGDGLPELTLFGVPTDSRRAMDLTHVFSVDRRGFVYTRLDRLSLKWKQDWGTLTVGRTAVTWGDGLIFNIEDLFNPFDPRNVIRDYKTGDDVILLSTRINGQNWQFLAVPRRDAATGTLTRRDSSFAVYGRIPDGGNEWTVLAASHYNGWVAGGGRVQTIGGAVWRTDALLTENAAGGKGLAVLSNVDYSWVAFGKNMYGLVEGYFDTRGVSRPSEVTAHPELVQRLLRGETFTTGRAYLAGSLQVEFHPLVHGNLLVIGDLQGPSALVEPYVSWNVEEELELTAGAQFGLGKVGTEYGGFRDPVRGATLRTPVSFFLWLRSWF